MAITTLYANGCSWTAGDGVEQDPFFVEMFPNMTPVQKRNALGLDIANYAWPRYLAERLNIPNVVNDAIGGGSNARAFRMTLEYVAKLTEEQRAETLVIIGWTTIERGEIYLHGETSVEGQGGPGWYRFNAGQPFTAYYNCFSKSKLQNLNKYHELYVTEVYDDAAAIEMNFLQVFSLKNTLENLGVKYLFFSALNGGLSGPHPSAEVKQKDLMFTPLLRCNNIIDLKYSYNRFVVEKRLPLSSCIHPLIETNKVWAEYLDNELNARNILGDPS